MEPLFPSKLKKLLLSVAVIYSFQACLHYPALPFPTIKPKGIYHTVKKKQTLWRICKTYKVSLQEVAELNNIKKVSQIKAGDKIFIPRATRRLWVPPVSENKKNTKKSSPKPKPKRKIATHTGMFHWPLKGKVIRKFGVHKGIKYDGINIKARLGSAVKASYSGKVVFVSYLEGYGYTVIIQHKQNYATVYANNTANSVKKGQWIKRGQKIASVGTSSSSAKTPYLHFQIRKKNRPRNPLFYLPK